MAVNQAPYKPLPVTEQDAVQRHVSRDPADLLRASTARGGVGTVKPFDDEDLQGKSEWQGFGLVDLSGGIPEFYGEETVAEWKDQVGAFACRQMVSELGMNCGVVIRHLDVPYIEAQGQAAVAMQVLDVSSDVFFILDLLREPMYLKIDLWAKVLYISLFGVSQVLWLLIACCKALRRWREDMKKLEKDSGRFSVKLRWQTKARWLFGAAWENLFPCPTTVLSARRVVKRMPLGGQACWMTAYASEAAFKFRFERGAQSLWPTLILEDLPLMCLQAYFYSIIGKVGPIFIANSCLSLLSAMMKASMLWRQHQHRETYRAEVLSNMANAKSSGDNDKVQFWAGVFQDEFGYKPRT